MKRKNIRLEEYDYSSEGAYFITICTQNRYPLFGEISHSQMILNVWGRIVDDCVRQTINQYANTKIDCYIIMPNHVHAIVIIGDIVGTAFPGPDSTKQKVSLGRIIGYFKYISTKRLNQTVVTPGQKIWQRNYYDHIIRNDEDLIRCQKYIINNPRKWELDEYYC